MKSIVLIFLTFLLVQCSKKDDDIAVCSPPNTSKYLFIIDKVTDVNILSNGRFTSNQIKIVTVPENLFQNYFRFQRDFIDIFPIEQEGLFDVTIFLNDEIFIPLSISNLKKNTECGNFYMLDKILSKNPDYILSEREQNKITIKI